MTARKRHGPKRILQPSIIGEKGIALIHQRVSAMGYLWTPSGSVEAGIDGQIELRDSVSGEVFNAIVRVQSKATEAALSASGSSAIEFTCDQRDIDYWLKGNAPVILVRSNPDSNEAYWKSIKDYFADPKRRASRKIIFDKNADRFDDSAKQSIRNLAIPADQGVYFSPVPKHERLLSNLLPVASFAPRLWLADTPFDFAKDLYEAARAKDIRLSGECMVRKKRLLSFHDLSQHPWRQFCDQGTVESFPTSEWSETTDEQKQRDFVELLGRCLTERMGKLPLRRDKVRKYYYFMKTKNLTPREFTYPSLRRKAKKTVFQGYGTNKADPTKVAYYRHTAFEAFFRRYDKTWYLEIVPTYHFTTDGITPHPYYESKLKGIKALERNNAVRNLVMMWASVFFGHAGELLPDANVIQFERALLEFDLGAGLLDAEWAPLDVSIVGGSDDEVLELFDEG